GNQKGGIANVPLRIDSSYSHPLRIIETIPQRLITKNQ
ncbi:unnamed protein product, partial [Rotaria socialis]